MVYNLIRHALEVKILKKNQFTFGIVLLIILIFIGFLINKQNPKHSTVWILGIVIGFTLQRSGFCFTAAFRDPILVGGTDHTKSAILSISIATVGFSIIQYKVFQTGDLVPGNISPIGLHVAVGAFLFGIGMVIADGCTARILTRLGEGFLIQILTLIFFSIGSLIAAKGFNFWERISIAKGKDIFMPYIIGWIPSLILQFSILIILYILANWYGKKHTGY